MNPFETHFLFLFVYYFVFACMPAERPWVPKVIHYCTCVPCSCGSGRRIKHATSPGEERGRRLLPGPAARDCKYPWFTGIGDLIDPRLNLYRKTEFASTDESKAKARSTLDSGGAWRAGCKRRNEGLHTIYGRGPSRYSPLPIAPIVL